MYYNENVAGACGRKVNYADGTVAGDFYRKCGNNNVGGTGRIRCNCDCVYDCLLELLDAAEENNNNNRRPVCCGSWENPVSPGGGNRHRCDCVYNCLHELLEDAVESEEESNRCRCGCCGCCRCCRR